MRLIEAGVCEYRFGFAEKGKVFFECRLAEEYYGLDEILVMCKEYCPLYLDSTISR
jgi:hypothetical protein